MDDLESRLAAKIAVIRQEFLVRLQTDWLPNLQLLRQGFIETPADKAWRTELMRAAHNMTGSGSVFGCDDITTVGRQLENRIRETIDNDVVKADKDYCDILGLVDQLVEVCTAALGEAKSASDPAKP